MKKGTRQGARECNAPSEPARELLSLPLVRVVGNAPQNLEHVELAGGEAATGLVLAVVLDLVVPRVARHERTARRSATRGRLAAAVGIVVVAVPPRHVTLVEEGWWQLTMPLCGRKKVLQVDRVTRWVRGAEIGGRRHVRHGRGRRVGHCCGTCRRALGVRHIH